jgi:ribose transport system permease protein
MTSPRFVSLIRRSSYSGTAWILFAALLVVAGVRAPYLFTDSGAGSLILTAAPLILAAMAVTATALVGSGVDLSIGPLIILVNVTIVKFLFENQVGTTAIVVAVALGVGVAIELIQALVITFVRIEPVIVSLSAFLALSGLDLVILSQPEGQAPNWLAHWGAGQSILSPMTFFVGGGIVVWAVLSRTPFFANIRLVGSNPRTAFVSGVPVGLTRVGAHMISGLFAGAAGLAYTGMIASGNPAQGGTYTLATVTALVVGGTSLAGGRGGVLGSIPGALAVTMISFVLTTFPLGALSGNVTQLTYGLILVVALVVGTVVPAWSKRRRAHLS